MRDFAAVGLAFIGDPNGGSGHVANLSGFLPRVNESEPGRGAAACALETWTRCRSGALELLLYIPRRSGMHDGGSNPLSQTVSTIESMLRPFPFPLPPSPFKPGRDGQSFRQTQTQTVHPLSSNSKSA